MIPEVTAVLIKIIRTSQFDVGIRAIAIDSLRKMFIKQLRIDDSINKDLYKVVKLGLADKSMIIQLRSINVFVRSIVLISKASRSHVSSDLSYRFSCGPGQYKGAARPMHGYTFDESTNSSSPDSGQSSTLFNEKSTYRRYFQRRRWPREIKETENCTYKGGRRG